MAKKLPTIYRSFTTAVDYFLLFAHICIFQSFSYVSVLAHNNPSVENTCQSVECVTTHNMFFIGQQRVVSSWTACWGSQIFHLYEITPLFLLRVCPALGPLLVDLKYFISIIIVFTSLSCCDARVIFRYSLLSICRLRCCK